MAQALTYLGKPGKPDTQTLPVEGIPQAFETGKPRVFSETYCASLGIYGKRDCDQFARDLAARLNAGRAPGQELVSLKEVDDEEDSGVAKGSHTSISTGSAGKEALPSVITAGHGSGVAGPMATQMAFGPASAETPHEGTAQGPELPTADGAAAAAGKPAKPSRTKSKE